VPGGGGNVVYLYALAHHLGLDRPFYGLQARGLDGQSTPHASIEEMAADYLDEVVTVQPTGPYLIGGHSSGSWVAFEMARRLQTRGQEVAMVAVIDTPAPISETRTSDIDADEALYLARVARLIERWAGKDLGISYEVLQPLTPAGRMDYLEERLKTVDILPPQAGRPQVHGLVQVFKASTRNCCRYIARGAYPGAVALLRATQIHIDDRDIRINLRSNDETWGWNQLAGSKVDVRIVPGDHVTMMAEPHVRDLASQLAACISKAEDGAA
jgi:thioesterase domain-containing protein